VGGAGGSARGRRPSRDQPSCRRGRVPFPCGPSLERCARSASAQSRDLGAAAVARTGRPRHGPHRRAPRRDAGPGPARSVRRALVQVGGLPAGGAGDPARRTCRGPGAADARHDPPGHSARLPVAPSGAAARPGAGVQLGEPFRASASRASTSTSSRVRAVPWWKSSRAPERSSGCSWGSGGRSGTRTPWRTRSRTSCRSCR
jgi:hypothetical protein